MINMTGHCSIQDGKLIIQEPEPSEAGIFYYNTYEKVMTWKKNVFCISAKTKEEANAAMKKLFHDGELDCSCDNPMDLELIPHWCDAGEYYEGDDENVSYAENNYKPTEELYDDEGNLLDDNTPIEVKRDKKINLLLGQQNK